MSSSISSSVRRTDTTPPGLWPGYAVYRLRQRYGVSVCDTEFGRQLGGGLFEFRLRVKARTDCESALLRVFCHAAGDRVILLLGGYDKGKDAGRRRQDNEIKVARRLTEHRRRQRGVDRDSPRQE